MPQVQGVISRRDAYSHFASIIVDSELDNSQNVHCYLHIANCEQAAPALSLEGLGPVLLENVRSRHPKRIEQTRERERIKGGKE